LIFDPLLASYVAN